MAKPSYFENLIRTPKKRGIYFWVRRSASLIIAFCGYTWLKTHINDTGALLASIVLFFVIYIFISHYIALIVMMFEDMMS